MDIYNCSSHWLDWRQQWCLNLQGCPYASLAVNQIESVRVDRNHQQYMLNRIKYNQIISFSRTIGRGKVKDFLTPCVISWPQNDAGYDWEAVPTWWWKQPISTLCRVHSHFFETMVGHQGNICNICRGIYQEFTRFMASADQDTKNVIKNIQCCHECSEKQRQQGFKTRWFIPRDSAGWKK